MPQSGINRDKFWYVCYHPLQILLVPNKNLIIQEVPILNSHQSPSLQSGKLQSKKEVPRFTFKLELVRTRV